MKPVEYWMCQACDTIHRTEEAALTCHPPWYAWECGRCGETWNSLVDAKWCCVEDAEDDGR